MQKINWKIKSQSEWIHFKAYIPQAYITTEKLYENQEKNTIHFLNFPIFFLGVYYL